MKIDRLTEEINRYDWSALRTADGRAASVPAALVALQNSSSAQEAQAAYRRIDNTVVLQGMLFEAAVPTIVCLLSMLQRCTKEARPYVLELIVQMSGGEAHPSEIELGNTDLPEKCVREFLRGAPFYFEILETGTEVEREFCVDLLEGCYLHDESLKERAKWWFKKCRDEGLLPGIEVLVNKLLAEP